MADIPSYLVSDDRTVPADLVTAAADVLNRLNLFWERIAIDSTPDFDGRDIQDDEIHGGAASLVGLLLSPVSQP